MSNIKFSRKQFEENLERFMRFYDRIKGRREVKDRVAVLANPDNPKSMSILSRGQCEFVSTAFFANKPEEWGNTFEGLQALAGEVMEVSPSEKGEGREQSIRFMGALSESAFIRKMGFTLAGEGKEQ